MVTSQVTASFSPVNPELAVSELAKMVLGDQPLDRRLKRVVELTKQVVPDAVDVSVTVIRKWQARTVVFTGHQALELDERQYDAGFGPCTDAAITGRTVWITTTENDNPYRDFCRAARDHGVTHVVAIPFPARERVQGGLNLYLSRDQPPDDYYLETTGETFPGYAAVAAANTVLHQDAVDLAQRLQAALHSRGVLEQAKGILMALHRCSSETAYTHLTETAQRHHLKLWNAAAAIVADVERGKHS